MPKYNLSQILTDIYNSEINVSITSFWDAGYQISLGDETVTHYPDSEFAKKYGR